MAYNSQIGLSQTEKLLVEVSKSLDRIIKLLPRRVNTTTTTTTISLTTTTTTTAEPFMMKFDDLANADLMIGGDSADVADWNTFFDLPTNGTPFNNISLAGTAPCTITLYGGGNMTLSAYLFGDNEPTGTSLLEVVDNGITVACEDGVFSDYNVGEWVLCFVKVVLPSLNINNKINIFGDCAILEELDIDFDSIIIVGNNSFDSCLLLPNIYLPNCTTIGIESFRDCDTFTELIFPNVTYLDSRAFSGCGNIITASLPLCIEIYIRAFRSCLSLSTIDLSSVTYMEYNSGVEVFQNISGNTITLTIPHAIESNDNIVILKANNTVTVNYSD